MRREAPVAGPPSPAEDSAPLPATVLIVPSEASRRTRLLIPSEMYRPPSGPISRPFGLRRVAAVPGPPSPEKPSTPVPATVEIVPSGSTLRTRWEALSAMNRLPAPSRATAWGVLMAAAVAGPPSPFEAGTPVPATVVIVPSGVMRRIRWFPPSAM
jgi:hypothetical protein